MYKGEENREYVLLYRCCYLYFPRSTQNPYNCPLTYFHKTTNRKLRMSYNSDITQTRDVTHDITNTQATPE